MVQWTSDKDQLLLKGVFQFCDIKCNAPLLRHLADMIGEDCTPKAVSHRLNNIKNTGKMVKSGSDAGTPSKITSAKSTPRGRTKGAKAKAADDDSPHNGDEAMTTPTTKKRGRKAKKSTEGVEEQDEGEETPAKKIKSEPLGFDDIVRGVAFKHDDDDVML